MKTKIIIEKLQQKWFPSSEDKTWKQWVDYKNRETNDLVELINSDVRDSFKRRAIFLLLVPSSEFNPIYWKEEVGKFYHNLNFLENLNPDLLNYATDILIEFHSMLKPMHCDRPKQHIQGGGGVTIFMSVPDKYHGALYFYNKCILHLLSISSEEKCEQIFPFFSLLDISTYSNMEDSSGYNPFQSLLYSKVDEKWKRRADETMKQIIRDELAGKTKPREEWEDALNCYAYIVKLQLYDESLPYSVDFFANQIKFLVSEEYYGKGLLKNWKVSKVFQFLSDDIYKEIRCQFTKSMISDNKNEFSVWSEENLQGAKMMMEELGQSEEKLTEQIQSAIKKYHERSVESKKSKTNAKNVEDKILSQMM